MYDCCVLLYVSYLLVGHDRLVTKVTLASVLHAYKRDMMYDWVIDVLFGANPYE